MEQILSLLTPLLKWVGLAVAIIALIVGVCVVVKILYKKAPPNKAMIITGPRGNRAVVGKGAWVIPVIHQVDYMSLENIQSDFTSKDEIPTSDAINILVDAVANVSISQDPELLKIAASKFLGYSTDKIREIITPVFEGNIREIISQTTLKQLIQGDKKQFAEMVIDNVTPNLQDMGLELVTFNIQNFKDRNGVIENLGLENITQITKDASISKANADRDIEVAQAEARRLSNEARIKAETEIAKKNTELEIQKAELKKQADVKRAEADAAYKIQQEEQRRTIEITTANANLARQEKELELKEREVAIQEKQLEASIMKKAEAEKYAVQQQAEASQYERQKDAEAELFERQRNAEAEKFEAEQKAEALKAKAAADRFAKEEEAAAIRAAGLAEAEAISAKGRAEAAAAQAKALAEAEGILKKAEAMKEYGDAAREQMKIDALKVLFEQYPKIAEAIGKGYANIGEIKMFGGDTSQLANNIMNTVTQVSEGLESSMGIDIKSLLSGFLGGKIASGNTKRLAVDNDCDCDEEEAW